MPRPSAWSLVLPSLLVLSLAYFAQSYISPLGPAPHLGTGVALYGAALSSLIGHAQAAIMAPFHTKAQSGSEIQMPLAQPHLTSERPDAETATETHEDIFDGDVDADADPRPRFKRRIIAVGDIHGDLENAHRVLQMAEVVDEAGYWTGKVDVFVQTGDIIDRGDDTIELFQWMEELREQAHGVGGTIISLLGNHEWMNAIGDWRYVYPSEIETFGSISERQKVVTTGWLANTWAGNYTTAARLPLHSLLGPPNTDYPPPEDGKNAHANAGPLSHAAFSFVHGGLAPSYSNLQPFPSAINNISASLLHKLRSRDPQPPPHPPHAYPGLPAGTTREEARMYGSDGPLWYRGWAEGDEARMCAQVDQVLQKTGTRRMVMGHTPNMRNIVARCGGKVLIIDTGISRAYGGVLSALSIDYSLEPVKGGGWKEQEVVKALYAEQDDELLVHATRSLAVDALV
ncbi:Metallo-dependent phosphatase-like protein [Scleroderma yunnanense]